MSRQIRHKTDYPGVYYVEIRRWRNKPAGSKNIEKVFYIQYRRNGKLIEEKAGRQYKDDMTAARANLKRAERIEGRELSNNERRAAKEQAKKAKCTIDDLWEEYKKNNPDLKGFITDENRYKLHIKPRFGSKEPKELNPLDVDRMRLELKKTKAPGTVKNALELLRRIINFGANKQLCSSINFKIKIPSVNNLKTEDLNSKQLSKLLEAIEEDEHPQAGPLMKMALLTGMRRGELFRLKWEDVDFERGFIHIKNPKGGEDQEIPLNDEARKLLEHHTRTESPYIFPGREGKQRTDINHRLKMIKEKAGLPKDFRALHGLRHVYASMLASSGEVDLYTLQKLLTHKSPLMSQRYAHLRDETLRKASSIAERFFNKPDEKELDKAESLD